MKNENFNLKINSQAITLTKGQLQDTKITVLQMQEIS